MSGEAAGHADGRPPQPTAADGSTGGSTEELIRIHPETGRSWTLPSAVYHDAGLFALQKERVFARTWQFAGHADHVRAAGHVMPFTLLDGCLDEPLVLSRSDDGVLHCLSNVCTHRGALVVEGEGHVRGLRCRYHGRRFGLDGQFHSMPEFDDVHDFPAESDHLPELPLARWGPLLFTSVDPAFPFDAWIAPVLERTAFLDIDQLRFDRDGARDYTIDANWALYTDNYLEEFHIPYVHAASLGDKLDYGEYRTELFEWGNLQLGVAKEGGDAFDLPDDHPEAGQRISAFYFWLFPNLMLNFYPWGLSVNVVRPLGPDRTRVSFLPWVIDSSRRTTGAGADLHRVEMEDEEVVESVQRGVRSRLYDRGRFSPRREVGTHHFHGMLAGFMNGEIQPASPVSRGGASGG